MSRTIGSTSASLRACVYPMSTPGTSTNHQSPDLRTRAS